MNQFKIHKSDQPFRELFLRHTLNGPLQSYPSELEIGNFSLFLNWLNCEYRKRVDKLRQVSEMSQQGKEGDVLVLRRRILQERGSNRIKSFSKIKSHETMNWAPSDFWEVASMRG